ncbi:MAG: hypothetical protein ACE5OQ_09015 [Woeseia sp.]
MTNRYTELPSLGLMLLGMLSACTLPPDIGRIEVPAGPGSTSPNLDVGNDGTVVLSWLQPDGAGHILKFSVLDDSDWRTPRVVARGEDWFVNWADFPSVVPISNTFWASHWLVRRPAGGYAYDIAVSVSNDAGKGWSDPFPPHRDGTDTEHGFVSLFPHRSGAGLIWLDGRNMVNESADEDAASGMTLRAAVVSPDLSLSNELLVDDLICDCCQTDVAVTSGEPMAVYRNRTQDEIRDIYVSQYRDHRWQQGRSVADDGWEIPGCPVNGPAIDAREAVVAIAWFTAADDLPRVRVRFSDNAGESYSAPVEVAHEETLGRVGVALLPDGDAAVSWLRKTESDHAELCVRRVAKDGDMGPVHIVSGSDQIPALSVPQMLRAGGKLVFAWTRMDDGVTGIASAVVSIDTL